MISDSPERKRNRSPDAFALMRAPSTYSMDLEQRFVRQPRRKAEEHWNMYLRALADLENFQGGAKDVHEI